MTDITTEDLLEVARGLGYEYRDGVIFKRDPETKNTYGHTNFNPLTSDADAFKVLEALVEKTDIDIYKPRKDYCVVAIDGEPYSGSLRTAIVKAYLSLIGERK